MANNYNTNPIQIDSVMASGWRALQTLNTGSLPGYTAVRQPGFKVAKVIWRGIVAQGDNFSISDSNDATNVYLSDVAGAGLVAIQYDFTRHADWRDFKVTAITSGVLLIYYR